MIELAEILNKYRVSQEQVAACTRHVDEQAHQVFYTVTNSRLLVNEQGEPLQYKVVFDRNFGKVRCLPFNGSWCPAAAEGSTCWHLRSALAHAAEYRAQHIESQARQMDELSREQQAEAAYTVQVDETSSSLDGVTFIQRDGHSVPMR
jgi:hypothetical protein